MPVTLTQVTDPFCTWCWGQEPALQRVRETYRDQVEFAFVMGGLVEDFESFCDAANDITDPADVAPHWEEAAASHGMPVDPSVWHDDPPTSSYPACIAYEAAALQDEQTAHRYLRRLREAIAVEGQNIERRDVLVAIAADVGLDVEAFEGALDHGRARSAFEEDRRWARRRGAATFPTFRVAASGDERWLRGFQSFDTLAAALESVAPRLDRHEPRSLPAFVADRGPVATREVATVYGWTADDARQRLRELADDGTLSARAVGDGQFWTAESGDANRTTSRI
jgi:putative protein-disulfide isomerase